MNPKQHPTAPQFMNTAVRVTKLETVERHVDIIVQHPLYWTPKDIKQRAENLVRGLPAEEFFFDGVVELEYIGEIL